MKKTIGFVTSGLPFNGKTIEQHSLGGSESALIYLARELAKLNNDVYVYCDCPEPGIYDNVVYAHYDKFINGQYPQLDVCIISRYADFLQKPIESNYTVLWNHDIPTQPLFHQLWQVDKMFVMSEYQKTLYAKEKFIDEIIHVTKNGYDNELASITSQREPSRRKNNYIYASRPERGLKLLIEKIWPRIIENDPLAQLHICGYENNSEQARANQALYDEINLLIEDSDNVVKHGSLTKKEYYKLLGKCSQMLYPTDFPEISCINAIEAQAMGVTVISTFDFAVKETVKTKTLVQNAEYGSEEYINKFLELMRIESVSVDMSEYAWSAIASEWNELFNNEFVARYNKYRHQIVNNLIYKSDIYAAWKLTGDQQYRLIIDQANKNNISYKVDGIHLDSTIDPETIIRFQTIVKSAGKYIEKNKTYTVLDLGCFTGLATTSMLTNYNEYIDKVYAYDGSSEALASFKEFRDNDKIEYICDNVTNVDKHGIKADIVIVGELLEHIEDTVGFLDKLMSVAKQDTLFIFTVPYGPWESLMIKDNPGKLMDIVNHIHHFEFSDILTLFRDVESTFFITRTYENNFTYRGNKLDNWVFGFKYTKKPTFNPINFEEKALKTRPYFSIATCIIAKNEEVNLMRCLKSVQKISDEIIVVDTGSTDDTKHIAEKFTDKIYDYEWNDSFEDARNFSISKTNCDWILYIDADEELQDSTILGKIAENVFYDGVIIEQRQITNMTDNLNENQNPTRMFRNSNGIKFYGIIHELPGFDENTLVEKALNQREAYINHYGYVNRDIIFGQKLGRNHSLLKLDMEKYPNRWFNKLYYIRDMYFLMLDQANKTGRFNEKYINDMVDSWDEFFSGKENSYYLWNYAKGLAYHYIQALYADAVEYKFSIRNKHPFKKLTNDGSEKYFLTDDEYQQYLKDNPAREDNQLKIVPILVAKLPVTGIEDAKVPCGSCNMCCKHLDAFLTPTEIISGKYQMEFRPPHTVNSLKDQGLPENSGAFRLARKKNNECVYLIEEKCSIYDNRPYSCRRYDCRVSIEHTPETKKAAINIISRKNI